jgi:hypothetical protein
MAPPAASGTYSGRSIEELVANGTKEEWNYLVSIVVMNNVRIDLPAIDTDKSKLPFYGYKQLIGLLIESKDFQRLVTETVDIAGEKKTKLSSQIRGDEFLTRGLGALSVLLLEKTISYNPVNETEWKYLNIVLDCLTPQEKEGKTRVWNINTSHGPVKITAQIEDGQWVYKV